MSAKEKVANVLGRIAGVGSSVTSILTALLAALLIIYSGYALYDSFYTNYNARSAWDILQYRPEIIEDGAVPSANFDQLLAKNEQVVGWITLYDTNIDYPIAQGKNNLEYASKDIFGKSSLTGSIYLASENNRDFDDQYNLLYGHHMDNGAMFGDLDLFTDPDFLQTHTEGVLLTQQQIYDLEIFAILKTDAYDVNVYDVAGINEASLSTAANFVRKNALYSMEATQTSKMLAMSTCANSETNGRLILFAWMTPRQAPVDPATPGYTPGPQAEPQPQTQTTNPEPQIGPAEIESLPEDAIEPTPAPDDTKITKPEDDIADDQLPLAEFVNKFIPHGQAGTDAWALLNLICLILTVYIFIPIHRSKAKFARYKMMDKANTQAQRLYDNSETDEEIFDNIDSFARKAIIGLAIELILSIFSIVLFIITEDMRLPMVIIDKWSPAMLLLLFGSWITDYLLERSNADEHNDVQEA